MIFIYRDFREINIKYQIIHDTGHNKKYKQRRKCHEQQHENEDKGAEARKGKMCKLIKAANQFPRGDTAGMCINHREDAVGLAGNVT